MRFFDTFPFSSSAEYPLLVAKILSEASFVENFFIVEGSRTFKGVKREYILDILIQKDSRLRGLLDRIKIIRTDVPDPKLTVRSLIEPPAILLKQIYDGVDYKLAYKASLERQYFSREHFIRDSVLPYLLDARLKESDWVMISDVDEILDVSLANRHHKLIAALNTNSRIINLQRQRYVFDIDNIDSRFRTIPLVRGKHILENLSRGLSRYRGPNVGILQPFFDTLVFEFSSCLFPNQIIEKYNSSSHQSIDKIRIEEALLNNHNILNSFSRSNKISWFSKVELRSESHPLYIIENQSEFKTGIVSPEYMDNRLRNYPQFFTSDS